jgi:undecaprenyl-diphosphatase
MPAVVLGVLFADLIHEYLFNPITVARPWWWAASSCSGPSAASTGAGGPCRRHALERRAEDRLRPVPGDDPGHLASGSTIIGGLLFGLSRKAATEFSFFLAMPTMVGAAVYSGYKYRDLFQPATCRCSPSASSRRSSSP